MKTRFSIAISSLLIITLVMCFATSFAAESKTITLWSGYPDRVPIFKEAAADYMKVHPNVSIQVTPFDLRQAEQKFAISLPAGTAPDLFDTSGVLAYQYVKEKMIDTAPPAVTKWLKMNFSKTYLDVFTEDKKIFAVPTVQAFQVLY
jgi:ABC-type glycerol-3-phosphate transport system substrate-binding protein